MTDLPPIDFQPVEPFLGARPPVVTRAEFQLSGFTQAHLRNGEFCGWWSPATLVTEIADQVKSEAPLVYAYYDGLDKVAHVHGMQRHYLDELKFVDALVERIIEELPEGATLLVTADHGMSKSFYCFDPSGNRIEIFCQILHGEDARTFMREAGAVLDPYELDQVVPA